MQRRTGHREARKGSRPARRAGNPSLLHVTTPRWLGCPTPGHRPPLRGYLACLLSCLPAFPMVHLLLTGRGALPPQRSAQRPSPWTISAVASTLVDWPSASCAVT
jgi:hypothetical protein